MTALEEYLSSAFRKIIQDDKKYVIVQAVRRSGKTRYICYKALLESIRSNSTIFIGVLNYNMIQMYKDELLTLYNIIPSGLKPKITGIYTKRIDFENGASVHLDHISGCQTLFTGMGIDCLLLDEFAFVPNRIAEEFFCNAMPALVKSKGCGSVQIISTRNNRSKKNAFWAVWLNAIDYKNSYTAYKITKKDAPWLDTRQFKQNMTRSQYDREFTIRTK